MNKPATTVALGLCLLLAAGCGADQDAHRSAGQDAAAVAREAGLSLRLDDGQRWSVDDHTRGSAARMARLIGEATPIGSVDEARSLAAQLREELGVLVEGCTMEGEAHDQLHVVLIGVFPRVDELESGDDPATLRATGERLAAVFRAYESHFE